MVMTVYPLAELAQGRAKAPARPGIYVFRAADQGALYVGKSKNLRSRLASYFRPGVAVARKPWALQRFASTVHIECTGSEFAALLREVELVQAWAPPYNRRLRHPERYAYIGVDYRDPFPRLTVTAVPWEGGQFLGPFSPTRRVTEAVEVIADAFRLRTCESEIVATPNGTACWRHQVRCCSAPCIAATTAGAYGRDLLQALLALTGRSRAALRALVQERDRLAAAERFEDAARRQRRIAAIEQARRLLFISQRVWHDALVVQPAAEPGTVQLWGIAGGSVRSQAICARGLLWQAFAQVWEGVHHAATREGEMIPQRELDARWIVHRWLRSAAGQRWSIPLRQQRRDVVWQRVQALADAAVASLFPGLQLGGKEW